jgi:hypothetical protein
LADTNGIKWHVVSDEETSVPGSGARPFIDVRQITYHVDSGPAMGTEGHVNVPIEQYNGQVVKAAIDAMITAHDEVSGL